MDAERYWPDLSLLPAGWRVESIIWRAGRPKIRLVRLDDGRAVITTGNHRTPAGAFDDAVTAAKAEA